MKPSLSDLKRALMCKTLLLSPAKKKYLIDNSPVDFSYSQRVLLAYVQTKLSTNPACEWENMARGRFKVSADDCLAIKEHLND